MRIHSNFSGGNIRVREIRGKDVYLENEMRGSTGDWFYWAFCVEGAEGNEVTFHFQQNRLGYFGPAVSHDLKTWRWLGVGESDRKFSYRFAGGETRVYFAHDMLYGVDRFYDFAERNGACVEELCRSKKGRSVPFLSFGRGKSLILTARHHACESTGSYVLEGVLDSLLRKPIEGIKVFCVPFTDFDGVIDGDQGKNRFPYDHNRDYEESTAAIYPEVAKIREYAVQNGAYLAFDFHSPWHKGGRNDYSFIVQKDEEKSALYAEFGELIEKHLTDGAFRYTKEQNIAPFVEWNKPNTPTFACFMSRLHDNLLAFTLETAYFGLEGNVVTVEGLVELGRCFAEAIRDFIERNENLK